MSRKRKNPTNKEARSGTKKSTKKGTPVGRKRTANKEDQLSKRGAAPSMPKSSKKPKPKTGKSVDHQPDLDDYVWPLIEEIEEEELLTENECDQIQDVYFADGPYFSITPEKFAKYFPSPGDPGQAFDIWVRIACAYRAYIDLVPAATEEDAKIIVQALRAISCGGVRRGFDISEADWELLKEFFFKGGSESDE